MPWLRWGSVALLSSLLLLDLLFPLPLPSRRDTSVVVAARDGSPLRAFADTQGIWRYPTTPEQVSPLYVQALLAYEDRWFWKHPGVNPVALLRAGGQVRGCAGVCTCVCVYVCMCLKRLFKTSGWGVFGFQR